MKKILGLVVLSLFAISASAADLMASSAAPTVTQNIVVEGAACPGVGATGFSSTGLLLSCQSGVWAKAMGDVEAGTVCGISGRSFNLSNSVWYNWYTSCGSTGSPYSTGTCPPGYTYRTSAAFGSAHVNLVWCQKS